MLKKQELDKQVKENSILWENFPAERRELPESF